MKVLFFGQTAEITGKREIDISFEKGIKASNAFEEVIDKFPLLRSNKLLFAVNQEYSKGDEILMDNDELAVFTAVSGG
jgi:molybdopterin converting factor small subunit